MSMRLNFADIYFQWMRDRSMQRGMELVREIQLTGWSLQQENKANLSNQSLGVQYHVIFVLGLIVICTLRSSVG